MRLLRICLIFAAIAASVPAFADKPVIGFAGLSSDSVRGATLLPMLERSLGETVAYAGIFDPVNTPLLRDQLSRFGCTGERCLSGFAHDAGISVLVTFSIRDRGDALYAEFSAVGSDVPYSGKLIYSSAYRLPLRKGASREEQLFCSDEISARFLSSLLDAYLCAVRCSLKDGLLTASEPLNGRFECIAVSEEIEGLRPFVKIGTFEFRNGVSSAAPSGDIRALVSYRTKADEIRAFLQGRKKEIVFTPPSYSETAAGVILYPVLSAAAPLLAPLGYFAASDYAGLGLWAVNSAPWLYLQYDGYRQGFLRMNTPRSRASSDDAARHYFFWYMLCAGNMPLFADAAASGGLARASLYQGKEPYLGNNATAVMLSLAGGGGGMFYKGHRGWGYAYFQANNLLLYMTLRSMVSSRSRDHSGITRSDMRRGDKSVFLLSSYALLKTVEIVHVLTAEESIDAAQETPGSCALVPGFDASGDSVSASLAVRYAF